MNKKSDDQILDGMALTPNRWMRQGNGHFSVELCRKRIATLRRDLKVPASCWAGGKAKQDNQAEMTDNGHYENI